MRVVLLAIAVACFIWLGVESQQRFHNECVAGTSSQTYDGTETDCTRYASVPGPNRQTMMFLALGGGAALVAGATLRPKGLR